VAYLSGIVGHNLANLGERPSYDAEADRYCL
jgi:hypothetical protein